MLPKSKPPDHFLVRVTPTEAHLLIDYRHTNLAGRSLIAQFVASTLRSAAYACDTENIVPFPLRKVRM